MEYRVVHNRLAIDVTDLGARLGRSESEIEQVLVTLGFIAFRVDAISLARRLIGRSQFSRGALARMAPHIVDCSLFTQWVWGRCGIELGRRSVQQADDGEPDDVDRPSKGSLLLTEGPRNFEADFPIGHAGLASGEGTVIHASNRIRGGVREKGVFEIPIVDFWRGNVRLARRLSPDGHKLITYRIPDDGDITRESDVYWQLWAYYNSGAREQQGSSL